MDTSIDTLQIERVLSHLARLRHRRVPENVNVLDSLKPAWLGMGTWDVILDDLEAQRYREHAPLRLVQG